MSKKNTEMVFLEILGKCLYHFTLKPNKVILHCSSLLLFMGVALRHFFPRFKFSSNQRIHFWNPRTVMIKHRDTSFYATDSATITCRLNSLKSYRLRVASRTPSPGITPACGSPIHKAQSLCFKAALFNEINGQVSRWSPLAPCFRITWSAC